MLRFNSRALFCLALSILAGAEAHAKPEDGSAAQKAAPGVAAFIGEQPISLADVDAKALGTNMKLAQSLYEARQQALHEIIMERLLKKESTTQGITLEELIQKRVAEKIQPVTDADVEAFYNANRARMRGQTLEAMSARIRQYLGSQRTTEARQNLLDELKKASNVRIALEPPRVEITIAANDPVQGPADAKVTIVEYADFQ